MGGAIGSFRQRVVVGGCTDTGGRPNFVQRIPGHGAGHSRWPADFTLSLILISLFLYIAALIMRETVGSEDKQVNDATENSEIPSDGFLHVIPLSFWWRLTVGGYGVLYITLAFLMMFGYSTSLSICTLRTQ